MPANVHNSVGAGETPKLGSGPITSLRTPGGRNEIKGNVGGDVPRDFASPGGAQELIPVGGSMDPKVLGDEKMGGGKSGSGQTRGRASEDPGSVW